jgi:ribonuclease Z
MTEIIFLGTTCMVPTKERNHQAILIDHQGIGILIDCGENTQRQLKIANKKVTDVDIILISHWHGDHVLGLPGLIQSMASSEYNKTLKIFGPEGLKQYIESMYKAFIFDKKIEVNVVEINEEGRFYENSKIILEAYKLEHTIPTLGYKFIEKDKIKIRLEYIKAKNIPEGPILGELQQGKDVEFNNEIIKSVDATYRVKGKVIGIIADTLLCKGCYRIAKDTDILISEASYISADSEKAELYKHLTAEQAGLVASQSNSKKLILTHISPRYKDVSVILNDAKQVFNNTDVAFDFMKIKI